MNIYRCILGFMLIAAVSVASSQPGTLEARPSKKWFDIPWDLRYFIFINSEQDMKIDIDASKNFNAQDGKYNEDYIYLDIQELLPSIKLTIPSKTTDIATASILFNKRGEVINKQSPFDRLIGKISILGIYILTQQGAEKKPYRFASLYQNAQDDTIFSYALCSITDLDRYSSDWDNSNPSGKVGCREWAAQLYSKRPYIDVTTYSKKGNFIGQLVGWAGFEDGATPIIGMQGKQWLCLHECPDGAQPGVIADMQAWTSKYGFPMPAPPPKQPMYPDNDQVDGNNEFRSD